MLPPSAMTIKIGLRTTTRRILFLGAAAFLLQGCSNTPYPGNDEGNDVVYYRSFSEAPKHLDPQLSYTVSDGLLLSLCYESLFSYDYLARPLRLEPELALAVPTPVQTLSDNGRITEIRYPIGIQPGVHFVDDICFADGKGREVTSADLEYAFKRLADPDTNCPVVDSFSHILGFREFRKRLTALRKDLEQNKAAAPDSRPPSSRELYAAAGQIEGVRVTGRYSFEVVLDHQYPQILYWLAMRFICAMPWEAVEYYHGEMPPGESKRRKDFDQHPVGTGPYQFDWPAYNREARIVLVRNGGWWAARYPERGAPAAKFPATPGTPEDYALGIWTPDAAGRPVPQIDRIEWYREKETLSRFNKFLQGYYDASGIPHESFNQVIQNDALTPEMEAKGIRLVKDFGLDVFYIGFNMDDDEIGAPATFKDPQLEANRAEELDRRRKLRRAMSMAIDTREYLRIFFNNLGVEAQSPVPPGIFGYDADYRNPNRQYDPQLREARRLMREAGFANGIDPATGKPLRLTFDVGSTSTRARAVYNFYIDAWKQLGINVELAPTDYNKFQEKMHAGSYQIFTWGWLADYPDPENFLFLLYGPNSPKYGAHNPNHARYENARYDFLFKKMETLKNDQSATWMEPADDAAGTREVTMTRREIILQLRQILEDDCPWIPTQHSVDYLLYHKWMKHVKPHPITGSYMRYYTIDKDERARARRDWNQPVVWPAFALAAIVVAFIVPAAISIRKERR